MEKMSEQSAYSYPFTDSCEVHDTDAITTNVTTTTTTTATTTTTTATTNTKTTHPSQPTRKNNNCTTDKETFSRTGMPGSHPKLDKFNNQNYSNKQRKQMMRQEKGTLHVASDGRKLEDHNLSLHEASEDLILTKDLGSMQI
eukprot:TRINITY_DN5017_c0_g3_i1.p2 TRINITY_DN5017_c0_g3~~TRINITY_DN5017_c0_g3_i1.p2  ORF type:complete len:142 (-),score=62.97 TRINITY_DN5017_c0_g3_i1:394-819(-)